MLTLSNLCLDLTIGIATQQDKASHARWLGTHKLLVLWAVLHPL